jgi:hypothetical protein
MRTAVNAALAALNMHGMDSEQFKQADAQIAEREKEMRELQVMKRRLGALKKRRRQS